jgi:hypothetical protein
LVKQGYSVAHMNYVFHVGELLGLRNWRVGLLRTAWAFQSRYGHEKFSSCLHCADNGMTPGGPNGAPIVRPASKLFRDC